MYNCYIEEKQKTYVVYEYIEGNTLKELIRIKDDKELENLGIKVGKKIKDFEKINIEVSKEVIIKKFNEEIKSLINTAVELKEFYKNNTNHSLPEVDLKRLSKNFLNLKEYIDKESPVFIYNDINFNNVIIRKEEPVFVDIDGGNVKFRALDFRGNCWWGWTGENIEKERAIYRGIYKGIFGELIPLQFHKQLSFTMIYEFYLRLSKYGK